MEKNLQERLSDRTQLISELVKDLPRFTSVRIPADFLHRTIAMAAQEGTILGVLVSTLSSITEHHLFYRWYNTSREEREAGVPEEVENGFQQLEQHISLAQQIVMVCASVLDEQTFRALLTGVQQKGFQLLDEAKESESVTSKYYIGLRGPWGWLHMYSGNGEIVNTKIIDIFKARVTEIETLITQGTNIPDEVKFNCGRRLGNCTHFLEHQTAETLEGSANSDAVFFLDGMTGIIEELKAYVAGGEVLAMYLRRKQESQEEEDRRIEQAVQEEYDEAERDK